MNWHAILGSIGGALVAIGHGMPGTIGTILQAVGSAALLLTNTHAAVGSAPATSEDPPTGA